MGAGIDSLQDCGGGFMIRHLLTELWPIKDKLYSR